MSYANPPSAFAGAGGLCYGRGPVHPPSHPRAPVKPSRDIARLIEIMAALRTPGSGCPWDLEQNFATIAPYTLEEAYEVADAIARGDLADLKDELGDLLLQVVYPRPHGARLPKNKAPSISATWSRPSPPS